MKVNNYCVLKLWLRRRYFAFLICCLFLATPNLHAFASQSLKQNGKIIAQEVFGGLPAPDLAPKQLTLLTWNVCFLPYKLPLYFGGIRPAAARVEDVAALILQQMPDVLCLQEMHDNRNTKKLIELLSPFYHMFLYDVGPSLLTLNSGLFVASRYPLDKVRFKNYVYKGMQWGINKGYLEFFIMAEGKSLAYVINTHLQPYESSNDKAIRLLELSEVVDRLVRQADAINDLPVVVCGDLNIPRSSEEWSLSPINTEFIDAYGSIDDPVDQGNNTSTDFFEDLYHNPALTYAADKGNPKYQQIIDYLLLWRNSALQKPFFVERVAAYDINNPEGALSDHHALRATLHLTDQDEQSNR